MQRDNPSVHDSGGNVFADMGMPDAEERLAKAERSRTIRRAIHERGLTAARVEELLELEPGEVSDLLRGRLSRFGLERLERCLGALAREPSSDD